MGDDNFNVSVRIGLFAHSVTIAGGKVGKAWTLLAGE
jgi:hypothetical protein